MVTPSSKRVPCERKCQHEHLCPTPDRFVKPTNYTTNLQKSCLIYCPEYPILENPTVRSSHGRGVHGCPSNDPSSTEGPISICKRCRTRYRGRFGESGSIFPLPRGHHPHPRANTLLTPPNVPREFTMCGQADHLLDGREIIAIWVTRKCENL